MSASLVSNDILYFIDQSIPDIETFIKALPPASRITVVTSADDGLDQILTVLAGRHDVAALHIISHGRPGAIVLGNGHVDISTLATRPEAFIAVGQALAADADLLIYGCNVAEGEGGQTFLAKLSELTGANVAASQTLTGAAHLGGDWALDVRVGAVKAPVLNIPAYAGILTAPTISNITPIAFTENGPAQLLQGVTISGGSGYANGSITFGVTGATSGDQFTLTSDTNTNAAGAVSVDSAGNVYLGTGTSRDLIGTVDATNNGKNGLPLTIRLAGTSTGGLTNTSFEGTTNGWTFGDSRVILGTTKINGFVTPTDLTAPKNSTLGAGGGIDNGNIADMTYSHQLATDQHTAGNSSLRLVLSGHTSDGYDVVHGPYTNSNTFAAQAGDVFTFDWRAAAGGDAFDAFGYLMNADTGEFVRVLDATGTNETGVTNWATQSVTVPKAGNWFFVFVAGTYDFTGGKAVGGSLYIDNFKVLRSSVNDTVLTSLAKHVQYINTSEDPPAASRSLTIEVADGAGIRQTGSTIVDITPINDAAVLSSAVVALTEADTAAALSTSGQLTITDVDSPATFVAQTNKAGLYGSFSIAADGKWTYASSSAHNEFKANQVYSETFEVTSADGTKSSVTVNLTGTNDAPVVSGAVTGLATEDGASVTLDALRNATDADTGAVLAVVNIGTLPAGVSYDATSRSFTLDPKNTAYQTLAAGQTQTVTVAYSVSDGTTATPASVSWTVTGTNDAAILTPATANLTETDTAAALSASGQLTITDVDSPATFVAQANKAGLYGSFSIGIDGKWTYVASSAHNEFKAGVVYTDAFEVASADGTKTTVTVNLAGTNDAPVVSGAVTGAATEDGAVSTLDALKNATDADTGAVLAVVDIGTPLPAGVTYDTATHSFVLDPKNAAYQALGAGQSQNVTVTYNVSDGTAKVPASVSWTVAGTNDAPVVSGAVTGAAAEDGANVTLDALRNASDVDTGAVLAVVDVGTLPAGVTYDAATRSFTLDPKNAAYQALAAGQTQVVTVGYNVSDGTAKTPTSVSWTVTGANDAPVVSGIVTGAATKGSTSVTLDALKNASDVDSGAVLAVVDIGTLPAGVTYNAATHSFTLNPNDPAYASVGQGGYETVTVAYAISDGIATKPGSVSWTITGTNTAAVLSSAVVALTETDTAAALSTFAQLTITDVDSPATFVAQSNKAGQYGTFSIAADGRWTYVATSAHNEFKAGVTYTDAFEVASADGTKTTVTVNLAGTNDAPVVTGAVTGVATEDGTLSTLDALTNATDADTGAVLAVVDIGTLPPGVTYDAATHSFVLDPKNAAYQALGAGQTQTVTAAYNISDGTAKTPASVSWTVTGTNDAAVLTPVTAELTESDAVLATGGQLTITDVDSPATFVAQTNKAGQYGAFSVGTDGRWTYVASSAHNEFKAGLVYTDAFEVASADGTRTTVTVNLNGTNDAPVVSGAVTGVATEDGAASTLDALGNATDADTGAVLAVVDIGTLPAGVIYDTAAHAFTLDPAHPAFQFLAAGQTQTVTVAYSVSDGTTATPASVSWTVTGTNDAAILTPATANLTETDTAAALNASGQLTIMDVDSPATFVAQANKAGQYGTFSIANDGKWTYAASSAHNEFKAGVVYTDAFEVASADGTKTTVTVNLAGTNDAPVVSGAVTGAATEDGAVSTLDALGNATDADTGAVLAVVDIGTLPPGVTYDAATHSFVLDPAQAAYQSLGAGQTQNVTVGYNISDGTNSTAASVSWNVTGTNDEPTGGVSVGGTPNQGQALVATNDVVDPDGIDASTIAYQWQRQSPEGAWTFINGAAGATYIPTQADVDAGHIRAVLTYTDLGGVQSQVLGSAIPVANVNDAPTVSAPLVDQSMVEGSPWTFQVPAGTFSDVDSSLVYAATLADGSGLPSWLSFNSSTRTFSGTPPENFNGVLDLQVTASDGALSVGNGFKLTITPVNDAPQATDQTLTLGETARHIFSSADFGFTDLRDTPANAFLGVIITGLPTLGTLTLDGLAVLSGQTINVDFLDKLVFTPSTGASGTNYGSFTFQVQDDGGTAGGGQDRSSVHSFSFDILKNAPVNHTPTATQNLSLLVDEDASPGPLPIGAADPDNDHLTYLVKNGQGPQLGSLSIDQDQGTFTYTPATGASGSDAFTLLIDDGNGGIVEQNVAITINSVNDAPISANIAHVLSPGASYTFSGAEFAFSDTGDAPHPDAFKAIIVSDLPASGRLTLNNVDVAQGQVIDVASLSGLVFTAAPDATGSDYGSFTFKVQDTGGTAHGGQDTSNAYSVGFTIKSVDTATHDDLIEAGDGNDTIYGGQGNDEMQGEGGNDIIIGGTDNGHLAWTNGRLTDIVIGDNLYGNDGRDTYHFKQGDGVDLVWDFRPGEDVIDLTGYRIQGSSVLAAPETGYSLADVKVMFVRHVTAVNERMDAGNYLKLAVVLGDGDAMIFNDYPAPSDNDVALVLRDGALSSGQLLRLAQSHAIIEGSGGFGSIESSVVTAPLPGSAAPLTLAGTNDGDTLIGASGADTLYGNEGINSLNGKAGNDSIYGGNARDLMLGEDGDDTGYGNGGDDLIIGGSGSDKLYGAGGNDLIFGDDGDGIELPPTLLVPSGHGISAKVEIVTSWWGGFEARVTVAANESVGQWQLALRSRFKIDDLWGAQKAGEVSDTGGTLYTLGNVGWNGTLANGQTTTIGFTAHTNIAGALSTAEILQALSLSTDGTPAALPPLPVTGQVDAGIEVANSWSGGFEGRITLTADQNISYWKMLLKTKYTVDGFWNAEKAAEISSDGGTLYSLDNASYNGNLQKGQTVTIGFTARTGNPSVLTREQILDPDNISLATDQGLVNRSANGINRTLVGGAGDDKLFTGASRDILTGLSGRDTFVFDTKLNKRTNVDTITDFKVQDDTINLDNAIFRKIGKVGVLKKDYFVIGTKAKDKSDHVIYDNKKGILYYDADGTGQSAAVKFATLNKKLKMTYKDFFVI